MTSKGASISSGEDRELVGCTPAASVTTGVHRILADGLAESVGRKLKDDGTWAPPGCSLTGGVCSLTGMQEEEVRWACHREP